MKHLLIALLILMMVPPVFAAEADLSISRVGIRTVAPGPAEHFTGKVAVEILQAPVTPERTTTGSVHFDAGARTAWHTHPLGQTLIVTAGVGRVQVFGGPVQEIKVGDVVHIPPGVKHWHGAAATSAMTHLAVTEASDGKTVDWLELVSDAQYAAAKQDAETAPTQPSRAQRLLGDVAPKLAQLTDDVLFSDVWARPGLSRRDRSLVTVSALIAMNRPEQLRSHIKLGLENGLTKEELSEALTQLAFYAGWPSALSAAGVAREVFASQP
jgi:4-carboxymuconolactone decarboxylase